MQHISITMSITMEYKILIICSRNIRKQTVMKRFNYHVESFDVIKNCIKRAEYNNDSENVKEHFQLCESENFYENSFTIK